MPPKSPREPPRVLRLPPSKAEMPDYPTKAPAPQPVATASLMHPQSNKDDPTTWYTEKDRMSIVHVQAPHDPTTTYIHTRQQQTRILLTWALLALILFLTGAFL